MKKSKISFEEKISWWKGDLFEKDLIKLSLEKAYRDLMRTIRNFSNNVDHDKIVLESRKCLHYFIEKMLNSNIKNQGEFDKIHKESCEALIKSFKSQKFTVGQAQKWINMTFKYLHLLDYKPVEKIYEFCHIPIDNYILSITNYKMTIAWSKLNDYDEYIKYQKWFRENYNNEIPLDKEFYLWLEENQNRKK